ncbi:MAG: ADOP family duplicated permease [Vicinamibacterales bacterium]
MRHRLLDASERWFRLLLRFYPDDFRDDMGTSLVEAYRDRAREALNRGGLVSLAGVWIRALTDSLRNGPREWSRPAASWRRGGSWIRDAELATRRLLRAPALVVAMVGTITVGLGTFAVVYTVVQKILIDPMPYKDPDDVYFVWRDYRPMFDLNRGWLAGTDVAELQKAGNDIESAVGLRNGRVTFAAREGTDPTEIDMIFTSPNLFEVLGVTPLIGRGFAPHEVGPGRSAVIVLTHQLWTRLGADPAILGTNVRVNGQPHAVIGVMPPEFTFVMGASLGPPERADAFVTFNINLVETNPNGGSYGGLIRARRGTAPETVSAAVAAVGRLIDARDFKNRGLKLYPVGLKTDLVSRARPALLVLGFTGVFLLLVLMVNVALVLLARAAQREHEFAVSRSLGASSLAVVRATLIEGGVLGALGGVTATIAAVWATRTLLALAPLDLPRREAVVVDWRIGAVIVGVGLVAGLLAATAPAIWAARSSLSSLLASSSVRGGGGHGRMRGAMVVAQVALSLVLLCTGALVVRSFEGLLRADAGFKPDGLLTLRVPMPLQLFAKAADAIALQDRIERALAALPGVTGVSATDALPLTASASQTAISIPGAPGITGDQDRDRPLVDYIGARARYHEVMGMRIVAGRSFEEARRPGVFEGLIDRQLARHFFPTGDPLGAKIPFGENRAVTIVGVVDQARLYDVHQDGRPQVFLRAEDFDYRTLSFVVRTDQDPRSLIPTVRGVIRQIDPQLAVTDMRPMEEVVSDALRQQRVSATLIAGFAFGALLLAAVGLFGVVAGSVTRRRHELAVRLALGANHRSVLRLVLTEGAWLVALGLLIGAPGIYLAGGVIRGVLVDVSPWDPLTLASVSVGLALVAMAACYIPARRVLRIEAAQSLRLE